MRADRARPGFADGSRPTPADIEAEHFGGGIAGYSGQG
jgi:hypothetical protein